MSLSEGLISGDLQGPVPHESLPPGLRTKAKVKVKGKGKNYAKTRR